ncbi:carbamoyltransferase [Bradyrhizobium sp. 188]|uniref:carbamoyltransferase family protein n=1 Tax=Bradyrhizobium sp. 188 TaxID=2782656 RepID=UPI001FF8125B|nr:carbamoyltransferase [Bradyrhizobium sp. 188]MCK1502135.1 carbamoyltransferase [Bradyrhizobium sp. 188]
MLFLGISGGLNRLHENPLELPGAFLHDGAAVLVRDGTVVAGVEEERLNRIKHSNKFPGKAIRFCLDRAQALIGDVDRIAFYASEGYCNALLGRLVISQPTASIPLDARLLLHGLLSQEFGADIDPSRIVFVEHHLAHAVSAHAMSGFDESLILAIDGYGDFRSGMVAHGRGVDVIPLETFSQNDSLGLFYLEVIRFLGYGPFDEYKVMGLAPYGDPATFRELFRQFYELSPDGGYRVFLDRIAPALLANITVRRKGQPFTQQHQDISAAVQEALETIVDHVVRDRAKRTGLRRLCLAGGVAHNCTMNGKLLYSGLFDEIFVQPAAHDAGCALGAALLMSQQSGKPAPRRRLTNVYWGPDLGKEAALERELGQWARFLEVERAVDVADRAAQWMAKGDVIGWVQGRSEFGPRALGNRSILADPRPAENKGRINAMVKKREGYRPFAPSALEEDAAEFFDLPAEAAAFPFMIFVVKVREEKRRLLGAITHVDGTARLQTVSRTANPHYWELIAAFKRLTGVPILLNTSFNNNAEPIVDSASDAIATFLTTGLDGLVIGPFLVRKRAASRQDWLSLGLSLPPYARLHQSRCYVADQRLETSCEMRTSANSRDRVPITRQLYDLLATLDDETALGELLAGVDEGKWDALIAELRELWAQRYVTLRALPLHGAARTEPSIVARKALG